LSLFDLETFLDFFLSNNEEIIKLILNIFCDLFRNIQDQDIFKNSKTLPNFYRLENLDYLIKIIFENDLNVLSEVGKKVSHDEGEMDINPTIHTSLFTRKKSIILSNPKLIFDTDKDDPDANPIYICCKRETDLNHIKQVYDVISQELTRNVDNFTKYFILKIRSRNNELENGTFKLSTADLCWISFITDQEYLFRFLSKDNTMFITWKFMKMFSIPLWIKSEFKMKQFLEIVAKNEYKLLMKSEENANTGFKNLAEGVALYYLLANKTNTIIELFGREHQNDAILKFIKRDFNIEKNRKIAKSNADDLIGKKKYLFAAYFYLLADDLDNAVQICLNRMNDINLAVLIIRLYESPYRDIKEESAELLNKLYQEYFIEYGIAIRDPWLTVFGNLQQKKTDKALEYILNYNIEYNFENDKAIKENVLDHIESIELIREIFAINSFDYKLLIFCKNLEKLYLKQLEETQKNTKSVQNTNFADIWNMDEDEEDATQSNAGDTGLQAINIDYTGLSKLCLTNSLHRGVLYAPILNLYKQTNGELKLDTNSRNLLKNLICDRLLLDIINVSEQVDRYFKDIELFLNYLEKHKILKKKEIYNEINNLLLWVDNYRLAVTPSIKSDKILETLITLTQSSEKLILKNLNMLIDFNFAENINLEKIERLILTKIKEMSHYLLAVVNEELDKDDECLGVGGTVKLEEVDTKAKFQKTEENLYIFRIIFSFYTYLLFLAKSLRKYNKVSIIFDYLNEMVVDYKKLEIFEEKSSRHLGNIMILCQKLSKRIKKHTPSTDEALSFFVQILNISLMTTVNDFISNNIELNKNTLFKKSRSSGEKFHEKMCTKDHFLHENFKFIPLLLGLVNSYIDSFSMNFKKYVRNYTTVPLVFEIHEELKMLYMKNLSQETNFYKYSVIPIKLIFKNPDKLKNFESSFCLKKIVMKYISGLTKYIRYEKEWTKNENEEDVYRYSKESIRIVNEVFKNGIEILNFQEHSSINGFAINHCDVSNLAVSMKSHGHKKVNMLYHLLIKKRSDGK
jgi:hypothetical protein